MTNSPRAQGLIAEFTKLQLFRAGVRAGAGTRNQERDFLETQDSTAPKAGLRQHQHPRQQILAVLISRDSPLAPAGDEEMMEALPTSCLNTVPTGFCHWILRAAGQPQNTADFVSKQPQIPHRCVEFPFYVKKKKKQSKVNPKTSCAPPSSQHPGLGWCWLFL